MGDKKELIYKNIDSLQAVVNDINESSKLIEAEQEFIKNNILFETIGSVGGIGAGGIASAAALYGLGTAGVSAAGIPFM